jgi:predicted transcriptional regulator
MSLNSTNVEYFLICMMKGIDTMKSKNTNIQKRLPSGELEIMMIIWHANRPVTRFDIEQCLDASRNIAPTTLLSFLSRLHDKGFLKITKDGKNNIYTPIIQEQEYLQAESSHIIKNLYQNSVTNFLSAFSDGGNLSAKEIDELQAFLDQKKTECLKESEADLK